MKIEVKTNAPSPNASAPSKLFPEVRVSVKAVANERHELLIDGRKYSGGELINGKPIKLKRVLCGNRKFLRHRRGVLGRPGVAVF